MTNTNFQLKRAATKTQRFLMTKDNTPLKPRRITSSPSNQGKQIRRQTKQKTSTSPEVENTRFHQLSLDTPQDEHMQLKQQGKLKRIWPRHKNHKSEKNHQQSQAQPTHHPQQEKCGSQGQLISKHG
jgi:hypothetical protein